MERLGLAEADVEALVMDAEVVLDAAGTARAARNLVKNKKR